MKQARLSAVPASGNTVGKQSYRAILRRELRHRRRANAAYSQRAYARDLGLPSHRLGEILNGKQGVSPSRAEAMAKRLHLSAEERSYFVDLVRANHARSAGERAEARARLREARPGRKYRALELATLRVLSDWLPFALLELKKTIHFSEDVEKLAETFNVTGDSVRRAIGNLRRAGLLTIDEHGWQTSPAGTLSGKGIPSRAVKHYHRQVLMRAAAALYREPIENREFSSLVFAVDPNRLPLLKERVRRFVREVDAEFGGVGGCAEVACLALQLFRLTERSAK